MIRRVAFTKAIYAGCLGAAAWELVARGLVLAGVPVFDIVRTLGVLIQGTEAPAWKWWPVGMLLHSIVGAVWAIFYAYFVWSTFRTRPLFQGMIFSILPACLAGLIMVPQLDQMREFRPERLGLFAAAIGLGGPIMIVLGHLIYGAVLGSLYTRPVGYAAHRPFRINVNV
jgi:hypothetical protein